VHHGVSSVPLSNNVCDLGPMIDTDALGWTDSAQSSDIELGQLRILPPFTDAALPNELIELLPDICLSASWRRNFRRASQVLSSLADVTTECMRDSLYSAWVIPALRSRQHESKLFLDFLSRSSDSLAYNRRMARLLSTMPGGR
jgi:hypothetical protein